MAIGGYRVATESSRPTHIRKGNGRLDITMPNFASQFGAGMDNIVKSGLNYYQGVIDTGRALQKIGQKVSGWEANAATSSAIGIYGGTSIPN